jgi:pyruvyltransferase
MVCGSVLGWSDSNTIVWGAGFISNSTFITTIKTPKKICAVRGKLTREMLLKRDIDCPEVYGDPVLLMPKFYNPNIRKKHELGIIPHHIDKVLIPKLKEQFPNAYLIDIQGGTYTIINEILSCKRIVSSALHGIIGADAYGIPSIWIKLSDKVLGKGFKFRDYFSSVNRTDREPLIWTPQTKLEDIENKFKIYNKPEIDIEPLWNSCPFRRQS